MPYPKIDIAERLGRYSRLSLVSSCVEWTRKLDAYGYGRLVDGDKTKKAHKVAYELHFGPIPEGLMVCHSCDNRRCVNPMHLFLGTAQDNVQDMMVKGRHRPGGKPMPGCKNGNSKLSELQALEIRESTERNSQLAARYGVSMTTVQRIKAAKIWQHV